MADPAITQEVEIAQNEAGKLAEQASIVKVRSEADLKSATEMLVVIKRTARDIEKRRKAITQPLNLAIKEVNDLFKNPAGDLALAEKAIKDAILLYQERAIRRADKRTEKLTSQIDSGELDATKGQTKLDNIKQAPTSVSAEAGSSQVKSTTRIRIVNPAALPAEYFMRDRVIAALRIEVEQDMRHGRPLPAGAESYERSFVAVRAA